MPIEIVKLKSAMLKGALRTIDPSSSPNPKVKKGIHSKSKFPIHFYVADVYGSTRDVTKATSFELVSDKNNSGLPDAGSCIMYF